MLGIFASFSHPLFQDDPLLMLLRKHKKGTQASALIRGELSSLNLNALWLIADDAEVVANFLASNKTVTKVRLDYNHIETDGAKALAEALKCNNSVRWLALYSNEIGNEGAEALITVFATNVSLGFVKLGGNAIADEKKEMIQYLSATRNEILIPNAVRSAALFLIVIRRASDLEGMGYFAVIDKNIVRMIAMEVWATRRDPIWIDALPDEDSDLDWDGSWFE